MNIQIFGINKSFDTKKAQRFFTDRRIKFQFIDLKEKPMSKGEFQSVKNALKDYKLILDESNKDKDLLALISYLKSDEDKWEKIFENQNIMLLPIVRNGKQATAGYQPDIWKAWE